jgi:hypothetical protein
MERSIHANPKDGRAPMRVEKGTEGRLTAAWRRRVDSLLRALVPSQLPETDQIWLDSVDKIDEFTANLKNPAFDFSTISYVVISESVSDLYDIIAIFSALHERLPDHARIVYSSYNPLWAPAFRVAAWLGLTRKRSETKLYFESDLDSFMQMSGWENVRRIRRFLLPVRIPVASALFDRFLLRLPGLSRLSLNTVFIARKSQATEVTDHTVTVLIPCKDEEGNVEAVVERMPKFGRRLEILFIDDKSSDRTAERIKQLQEAQPQKNIVLVEGEGRGKGEAVRTGMRTASGEICMILDADLTVIPEDLPQFYNALKWRYADFVHGTRLVYDQEHGAMRLFNVLGNMGFAALFSYILEQRTTDTLCGTKAYWRRDWPLFEETREKLERVDVWGDYNLIFGAAYFGLKLAQLPVRYFERLEGETKMRKRLKNATIMLKVATQALRKVKFME